MNNIKMNNFVENRKIIQPISFINGKIKSNSEINGLFILPYDLAIMSRAEVNTNLEKIKESGTVSEESFDRFSRDFNRMNANNLEDAIYSFVYMNCTDFTYTFCLLAFSNIISKISPYIKKYKDNNNLDCFEFDLNNSSYVYLNYSQLMDLNKLIEDNLNLYNFGNVNSKDLNFVFYYQIMNNLYYRVIIFIDRLIKEFVRSYFLSDGMFKSIMEFVYNTEVDVSKFGIDFRYTFSSSIIREMMENELPNLYEGFHKIFYSAAAMKNTKDNPNNNNNEMLSILEYNNQNMINVEE